MARNYPNTHVRHDALMEIGGRVRVRRPELKYMQEATETW